MMLGRLVLLLTLSVVFLRLSTCLWMEVALVLVDHHGTFNQSIHSLVIFHLIARGHYLLT